VNRAPLLSRAPSPALVLCAIASVQIGSAVATKLFAQVGPGGASLLRLSWGSVILFALWRPGLTGMTRRQWVLAITFGLVLAAMNTAFYGAIDRIPLGVAVTIEFVGPLAVAVGGSRRPRDFIWAILAAAGIIALTHGGTAGLNTLGILLALLAGAMWAAYILINARLGRAFDSGSGLAIAMAVGALAALPFGIADGGAHLVAPRSLALGAAVGILSSAIPYSLELEALRRITTSLFGVLMSLEPAMAALTGFVLIGQQLSARALLGIALVVIASAGAALSSRQAPVTP
jgi:inner membrane transporter RhtA